ncbi:MAG TPA: MlaD family protein [Puia sp.]|jgi:phospholipid/cholesterol/gamma-HCH transport system substrate-binding protein|nr:MlaD family protein [Puia sp.]
MAATNNIKLGLLVLAGAALLIVTLYIIGKNENYFGSHFELRTRFENAQGLMAGNNVRFSGLQAGTVRSIRVIDDTTIEAVLLIDAAMRPYIHKNALASIGTEGLIGNKVVNILPTPKPAPLAEDGDLLPTRNQVNTDEMLRTLDQTNENIAGITRDLRLTITRINESSALWSLLNDRRLAANATASMEHVRRATIEAEQTLHDLHTLTTAVREGKGSVGALLTDTTFEHHLNDATEKIRLAAQRISDAAAQAQTLASSANSLIRDTTFVKNLNGSLENIRLGTAAFHEDMEALKHNFLLRGYFRRQEKAAKKAANPAKDQAAQ